MFSNETVLNKEITIFSVLVPGNRFLYGRVVLILQMYVVYFLTHGITGRVHTITKKHYIPENTFNYQKALRKHVQGGVGMPCLLLFYVCWVIKMYTGGKNRYMILKRD